MPEAVALCMPPTPGPILKRRFCDCSRMPCSWTLVGHRLFSNAPKDLVQQAYSEYVQKILLKRYLWNELQKTNLTLCMTEIGYVQNTVAKVFFKNEECRS